jgi:hypothetical protein
MIRRVRFSLPDTLLVEGLASRRGLTSAATAAETDRRFRSPEGLCASWNVGQVFIYWLDRFKQARHRLLRVRPYLREMRGVDRASLASLRVAPHAIASKNMASAIQEDRPRCTRLTDPHLRPDGAGRECRLVVLVERRDAFEVDDLEGGVRRDDLLACAQGRTTERRLTAGCRGYRGCEYFRSHPISSQSRPPCPRSLGAGPHRSSPTCPQWMRC